MRQFYGRWTHNQIMGSQNLLYCSAMWCGGVLKVSSSPLEGELTGSSWHLCYRPYVQCAPKGSSDVTGLLQWVWVVPLASEPRRLEQIGDIWYIRRHHWSKASIFRESVLETAQQSDPYRQIGRMHVLYNFCFHISIQHCTGILIQIYKIPRKNWFLFTNKILSHLDLPPSSEEPPVPFQLLYQLDLLSSVTLTLSSAFRLVLSVSVDSVKCPCSVFR